MLPSNPRKTKRLRISETVDFFPHRCAMKFRSASENATIELNEMVHAFKNPAPASPFRNIADNNIAAIAYLQQIFKKGNIKQVPTKKIQA